MTDLEQAASIIHGWSTVRATLARDIAAIGYDLRDTLSERESLELQGVYDILQAYILPEWEEHWSPNAGGTRSQTTGVVLHSTRGNAATPELEYQATINWFMNPASTASAHFVIGHDRRAMVVPLSAMAWHAGELNATHIGIEFVQARQGDAITDAQYAMGREALQVIRLVYGDLPMVEHKDTRQGQAYGKSDIGPPFDVSRL